MKDSFKDNCVRRIQIMTINACNNNCIFCCSRHPDLRGRQNGRSINSRSLKIECKKRANINSVMFTGGESMLHQNLPGLVKDARKMGYRNITLQTNGRLLKYKDACIDLLKKGVNEVHVSLHGSNSKIHDAMARTPGAFKQTCEGIDNIISLKKSFPLKIYTSFTITKMNYKDIYNYLLLLSSWGGIDGAVLNTLMYVGNAAAFFKQIFVSYTDIAKEFQSSLKKLQKTQRGIFFPINITPMPVCLMKGFEKYAGIQETPLQIQNNKVEILKRCSPTIKNKKCLPCAHKNVCSGIDAFYAKNIGWQEIIPWQI